MLLESNWNSPRFCGRLEQLGMCVQCTRWNLVGNSSLWKGRHIGSKLFGCIHQFGKCAEGSSHLWSVSDFWPILFFIFSHIIRMLFDSNVISTVWFGVILWMHIKWSLLCSQINWFYTNIQSQYLANFQSETVCLMFAKFTVGHLLDI